MAAQTLYRIADGNGNVYELHKDTLHYKPVRAAESSSGLYDGGAAATIIVQTATLAELVQAIDMLANARDQHVADRSKGTVAISILSQDQAHSFILPMGHAGATQLVAKLRTLLGR